MKQGEQGLGYWCGQVSDLDGGSRRWRVDVVEYVQVRLTLKRPVTASNHHRPWRTSPRHAWAKRSPLQLWRGVKSVELLSGLNRPDIYDLAKCQMI